MPCGCSSASVGGDTVHEDQPVGVAYQLPNETVECFAARVSPQDSESEAGAVIPPEHIIPDTIAVDCKMKTDTLFKMTKDSTSAPNIQWNLVMKDDQGDIVTPAELGLVYEEQTTDGNPTATLKGTFNSTFEKHTIRAHMKAFTTVALPDLNLDVGGIVDEKEYVIVPKLCDPNDLRFIHPDPGSDTGDLFGKRMHPIYHVMKQHQGVDFRSHGKNDIIASADGVVKFAGSGRPYTGYGNVIIIDHNDSSGNLIASTLYAHLSEMYVDVGQQVAAGVKIGHEGATGKVKGPHLHFEIRLGGTHPVDPMLYINGSIKVDPNSETASQDPNADPASTTTVNNTNKAVTREEVRVKIKCPQPGSNSTPAAAVSAQPLKSVKGCRHRAASCIPDGWVIPKKSVIARQIVDAMNSKGVTALEDQKYFICCALVESTLCQYAINPVSSATGLFQMINSTAAANFAKVGLLPTCENRCNVGYATIAMIPFFRSCLGRWNSYRAGSSKFTDPRLVPLSRNEFLYEVHGQGENGIYHGTKGFTGFLQNYAKSRALWDLPNIEAVIAAIDHLDT